MKRVCVPLSILTLGFGLAFRASALGQESGDKSPVPESTAQSDGLMSRPDSGARVSCSHGVVKQFRLVYVMCSHALCQVLVSNTVSESPHE